MYRYIYWKIYYFNKQDKSRLDMNIKKAGWLVGRRQESIDTAYRRLVPNKLRTILADKSHPLRPESDNGHIEATELGFPAVRRHDTCSQSVQRPVGHTVNKQPDKHNTQRLEMGMRGRWGWDQMEECLGVNGRRLFVPVDCSLEEWEHALMMHCLTVHYV